jgi:hypothetical protein
MNKNAITSLATALSALSLYLPVDAQSLNTLDQLEREEATWHKFMLFRTPLSIKDPQEAVKAIQWFQSRVEQKKNIDSRYAVTYSLLLWITGEPKLRETSMVYALAGYTQMQIEAAHCADQAEGAALASQWMDAMRGQLRAFQKLPAPLRKELGDRAVAYAMSLEAMRVEDPRSGSLWLCHLLPSYLAKIRMAPGVQITTIPNGNFNAVFVSHPDIRPDLASESDSLTRQQSILSVVRKRYEEP